MLFPKKEFPDYEIDDAKHLNSIVRFERMHAFLFWATGRLLVRWGVKDEVQLIVDCHLVGSTARSRSRIGEMTGNLLGDRMPHYKNRVAWNTVIAEHGVDKGARMLLENCINSVKDNDRVLIEAVILCATLYVENSGAFSTVIDLFTKRLIEEFDVYESESIIPKPIHSRPSFLPIIATILFAVGGYLHLRNK